MNLEIPANLASFVEMIRWLGQEYLRPLGLEADRTGRFTSPDHPFYMKLVEMGFMARQVEDVFRPKKEGGAPRKERERFGARRGVLMGEEASYWDRGMTVTLPGPGLGGPTITNLGTQAQKERFLECFRDPSAPHWGAFAMTEPDAGSDVSGIKTRARKEGDEWVLNGAKMFSSLSCRADWILAYATINPALGREGHRAFVIPRGAPGLSEPKPEKKMGLKAYETATFSLNDCRLPADHLVGGEEAYEGRAGFKTAMKGFDSTRPMIGAMAVGIGRAAYDHAEGFFRENYLPRGIPRHRRLLEKLSTMRRKLEMGRLLCWKAAYLADHRRPNTLEASCAKAFCAPIGLEATGLAMEILGDAGIARDHFVEKLFRDVKAMDLVEGTGQIQRLVIARRMVDYPRTEQGG